jgi:hypothetical protein
MNKSRLGLIVNMLLTPFIEKEFLREGGDCIENLAEAYHDAWCTDITDYYSECGSKRNMKPENSKWKDISLIDEIQKR